MSLGMTVRELLGLRLFRDARVVAGHGGLDRSVHSVNVMEVPDIVDWVREGDFVATTGFAIRDDPGAIEDLVPLLVRCRAAALAVKPRRFLPEIPAPMVREADRRQLPLIELPYHLSYSDVFHPVLAEVLKRQTAFLQQSDELHRHLMEVALAGNDLLAVARGLGERVGNPVLIQGRRAGVRAAYPGEEAIAALEAAREPPPAEVDGVREQAATGKGALFEYAWVETDGGRTLRVSAPIIAGGERFGRITVWERDRPLERLGYVAVERTITIAAFEIVKQQAVEEVERRYRNVFLDQLLSGTLESERTARERARMLSWEIDDAPLVVAVVGSESGIEDLYERVVHALSGASGTVRRPIAGEKAGRVVLVAPADRLAQPSPWLDALCATLPPEDARVGVGRPAAHLSRLPRSYREALQALDVGRRLPASHRVVCFEDLGVLRLLHQLADAEEAGAFLAESVLPLRSYDRTHGTELLRTLRVYFEEHGNARRAAERMFVHYNTILYRLRRIEEVTGLSLGDVEARLNLQVGLKLLHLRGGDGRPLRQRGG